METLRQMVLNGNQETYAAISGVTLISPDIDVDVFQAQASAIGALPDPFTVYTNDEDRALAFSAQITGTQERLGNVMDPDRVASLNVTLVDTTAYSVGSGHFNTGNSPELLSLLGQLELDKRNTKDLDRRPSAILPGMVLTVRNATEIVLAPLAAANPFAR
jgi:esterase/lipase superfamily enzyme